MDRQQFELLVTSGGFILFLAGFGAAWVAIPMLTTNQIIILLGVVALLMMAVSLRLSLFFHTYISGTKRLADELTTIITVNPTHRVDINRPGEMRYLAEKVNAFADRFQRLTDTQALQIQRAHENLEEEKNRLAALMSELAEGVIVCNIEGRILLYNHRAKKLLSEESPEDEKTKIESLGGFVGLGRSIFGLIDRNVITHALENLDYRREKQSEELVSQFVTTATNGQLIRTRIAPILSGHGHKEEPVTEDEATEINGFVLTLEDITQQSRSTSRRDSLLRTLTEGIRSSLANIRTAIETIEEYPEMDSEKLRQLRKIIYDESLTLSTKLNHTTEEYAADLKADWHFEEMLGSDLLWAIQRRFEDRLEISTSVTAEEINPWLRVDSYSVVQAMTFIMRRLKADFGIIKVSLRLKKTGDLAACDLVWQNGRVDMDTLWAWQNESINLEGKDTALTLGEVAELHGGEAWCQTDKTENTAYFRLLLPTIEPKMSGPEKPTVSKKIKLNGAGAEIEGINAEISQPSRPEYYDFDLFNQAGQTTEFEQASLTDLTCTVFDTETTGLNPSQGDEIISISAIRILNGRLLRQELFDQLIDPKRHVPQASIEVHGISPEMLAGKPPITSVLPIFYRFTEGTILVAHNAAFDMKMLQVKEATTGLKFTNPVLDTLLLSAVVHPNEKDHSLEVIAQRLGVNVFGRHTSMGDAILTGEVFLKLIPLLNEQGITTLGEAVKASERTYYARITY